MPLDPTYTKDQRFNVCDLPERYEQFKKLCSTPARYSNDKVCVPNVNLMPNGHSVSRSSNFIIYSVEADYIDRVVAECGPCTKLHAIVAGQTGQTSVKAPKRQAFEAHLPSDVRVVSCHSLHGPGVSPVGQPLVLIKHRASDEALALVESFLSLRPLTYEEHDSVTASTQAVTQAAFLPLQNQPSHLMRGCSMGLCTILPLGARPLRRRNQTRQSQPRPPYLLQRMARLRPASRSSTPSARSQIDQYANSASELFKLMLQGRPGSTDTVHQFRQRIEWTREMVFGDWDGTPQRSRRPILLSADRLDRFGLSWQVAPSPTPETDSEKTFSPPSKHRPNWHLSL